MVAGLSAGGGFVRSLRSSRGPPSPRLHGPARHRAGGRHCAGRVVDIGRPGPSRTPGAGVRRAGHRKHGLARCAPRESGRGNAARATRGGMRAMGEARNAARRSAVGATGVRGARPGPAAGAWNAEKWGQASRNPASRRRRGAVASAWAKKAPQGHGGQDGWVGSFFSGFRLSGRWRDGSGGPSRHRCNSRQWHRWGWCRRQSQRRPRWGSGQWFRWCRSQRRR